MKIEIWIKLRRRKQRIAKPFRILINGKNPSRIKFFDSHISVFRETSQEAHSHISSIPDIQRVN